MAAALAGSVNAAQLKNLVAQQKGHPVLVSFWASWCIPCIEEFPTLKALASQQPEVAVLAVSIDDDADRPAVERVVAEQRPPFPVYIRRTGSDQEFIDGVDREWSGVVPALLLFDREGHKAKLLEGEQSRADILAAIRRLLPHDPAPKPQASPGPHPQRPGDPGASSRATARRPQPATAP